VFTTGQTPTASIRQGSFAQRARMLEAWTWRSLVHAMSDFVGWGKEPMTSRSDAQEVVDSAEHGHVAPPHLMPNMLCSRRVLVAFSWGSVNRMFVNVTMLPRRNRVVAWR
jgi:hypothetical protein